MGKTTRLRLSEVRAVFRLLRDAQALRHDQIAQEQLLLDGMVDLLGATHGFAVRFNGYRRFDTIGVDRFVAGRIQDPVVLRYFTEWGASSEFADDPMIAHTVRRREPVTTVVQSRLFDERELRQYRIYPEMWEPASIRDVIVTFFRYGDRGLIRGYSFQRTRGESIYGVRHARLARLFTDELLAMKRCGVLEPPGPFDGLPPRLDRLARALRSGRSQKQIAADLGLSYHTVRSYAKELYDIVGAHSREDFIRRFSGS